MQDILERVENAQPPISYAPPPRTRSSTRALDEDASDSSSDDGVNSGEGVGGFSRSRPGSSSSSSIPLADAGDDSSEEKGADTDTSDEEGNGEYEVMRIEKFRRVGKKRGGIQYFARWKDGSATWEPAGSFRLDEPDVETGARYLSVFD